MAACGSTTRASWSRDGVLDGSGGWSGAGAERQARHAGEVGGDLAAYLLEHVETLANQFGLGNPARVARTIEGRNHAAGLVEYGYGERHDAIANSSSTAEYPVRRQSSINWRNLAGSVTVRS